MQLFSMIVLSALLTSSPARMELFVSPSGSDQNPGTREKPFRSLERARIGLRDLRKEAELPAGGAAVIIGEGIYRLSSTFRLDSADGGTPERPVTYSAEGSVRITGGKEVPPGAFHPVADRHVLRRLPPVARGNVMEADLKRLGVTDYGRHRQFGHGLPVVAAPMELFWNDTVLQLARYPNSGAVLMGDVVDTGSIPRIGDYTNRPGAFRYTDPRHARWAGASDVWFQGFFHHGFADDKILVASIDTVRRVVRFASPHMYGLGSGQNFNQYVALNLLEELDEPGEWYVDRSTGRVYVWPPGDIRHARINVSVLEAAIDRSRQQLACHAPGNHHRERKGTRDLTWKEEKHNRIENCIVSNVGTVGIMMGQGARQTFPHITADDYAGVPVSREVGSFHSHYYRNTVWDRNAGKKSDH